MGNKVLYKYQARTRPIRVWFAGDCALKEGVGVCYELGFQDANYRNINNVANKGLTDAFGFRGKAVMLPRTLTAKFFAGVTQQAYAAAPTPDGQPIDIIECPGDAAILIAVDVTAGSNSDSDGHVQCQKQERTVSGTHANAVIVGKTVTLSGETFISNGVVAGDVFYISAGTGVKTGGYTVAITPTAETVLTLVNAPGDYAGVGVGDLVFVIIERADTNGNAFNDANASGVFIDATGYGKSCAYAMQSGTYVTTNLLLAKLEDGNDDTGVI